MTEKEALPQSTAFSRAEDLLGLSGFQKELFRTVVNNSEFGQDERRLSQALFRFTEQYTRLQNEKRASGTEPSSYRLRYTNFREGINMYANTHVGEDNDIAAIALNTYVLLIKDGRIIEPNSKENEPLYKMAQLQAAAEIAP